MVHCCYLRSIAHLGLGLLFLFPALPKPLPALATPPDSILAQATDLKTSLSQLLVPLRESIAALKAADVPKARLAFLEFERGWDQIDDAVERQTDAGAEAIDDQVEQVEDLLIETPNPDRPQTVFALERLEQLITTTMPKL